MAGTPPAAHPRRLAPPAMLDVAEARLRSRAAPGIHGCTTSGAPSSSPANSDLHAVAGVTAIGGAAGRRDVAGHGQQLLVVEPDVVVVGRVAEAVLQLHAVLRRVEVPVRTRGHDRV